MLRKKKINRILSLMGILGMVLLQILPTYAQAAKVTSSLTSGADTSSADDTNATVTNKQGGPTVQVAFSAAEAFKNGSKVTATATTGGFSDPNDKLYYTWYLKRSGCDLNDDKDKVGKNNACDLDGDQKITVNDWKIAATRIIVRGDFVRTDANYSATSGFDEKLAGTDAVPAVYSSTGSENDSTTWRKTYDPSLDNGEDAPNCYVQQPKSGIIYELRKTGSTFDACPDGYHPACLKDTTATCDVMNPAYSQAVTAVLQWNNDHPSDPPRSIPAEILDGTIPKTIQDNFDACAVDKEDTTGDIFSCTVANDADLNHYQASLACKDSAGTPICTKDGANMDVRIVSSNSITLFGMLFNNTNPLIGRIFQKNAISSDSATNSVIGGNVCSALATENSNCAIPLNPLCDPPYHDPPPNFLDQAKSVSSCSALAGYLINGIKVDTTVQGVLAENAATVVKATAALSPTCTFAKKENLCKHLFPYFPKSNVDVKDTNVDLSGAKTGDGRFTLAEKEFWGADPTVASTNGKGKDEANVMGLGIDSFTWTYTTGDEVGVAVEGTTSLATEHNDSSYRIMWAFSKGVCSALEKIESGSSITGGTTAFYTEADGTIGIRTTDFDLNQCLEENLLTPDDSGASDMKVDLTAMPENPINDANGNGDLVTVIASPQNASDLKSVNYVWKIEKGDSGINPPNDDTSWTDITADMIKRYGSLSDGDKQGMGKNNFNFLLNLPASVIDPNGLGVFYLRIRVTATETSGIGSQTSKGSIVIKVRQQQNSIETYSVVAADKGDLGLANNGESAGLICDDDAGKSTCYVTKNQIVGLKIPNKENDLSVFSWKVNNVALTCTSDISSVFCNGSDNNVLFFPILGNVGEAVDVVATAVSKKTGATVEISRHFVIVEPQLQIVSDNTANVWPKVLGIYKDLNYYNSNDPAARSAHSMVDYSTQVFETNPGKTVTLKAVVYSAWNSGQAYSWSIDGELQNVNNSNPDKLTFLVDRNSGDSYNIGLVMTMDHTPEQGKKINNLRLALLKDWGVSPEDAIEQDSTANIQINVIDAVSQSVSSSGKTGIFASLITNLPERFMFLLKITLTAFVLIFSAGLLFAFIPETDLEREGDKFV